MARTLPAVATAVSVAAVLLIGTLSGCASAAPAHHSASHSGSGTGAGITAHSSSTATATATAKATATATPTPAPTLTALPANVLFRITATATDLKSHAIADLVETVYVPAPITAAQNALLVKVCGTSQYPSDYPNALGVAGSLSATLRAGSPAWTQYSPLAISVVMGNEEAWDAKFSPSKNLIACGPQSPLVIPSTATGVEAVSPATDPAGVSGGHGWYNGVYGWYVTDDIDNEDTAAPTDLISMTDCNLQLGAAAIAAAPKVAQWPAEPNPQYNNQACEYAPLD
jgi:hypothetical protein